MAYALSPELDRLIREGLATGRYASEEELLLEAMRALGERDETIAGVRDGLADFEAGRVRPLSCVDDDLRKKYDIPRDR